LQKNEKFSLFIQFFLIEKQIEINSAKIDPANQLNSKFIFNW